MIEINSVLKKLSDGADDVIGREYELRPQVIAQLIECVSKRTKENGYVIIGAVNKNNGYSLNGIDMGIDIERLVKLAIQQICPQIQAEYLIQFMGGKKICIIQAKKYVTDEKQLSNEIKVVNRETVFKDLFNACIKLQKNSTFINVLEDQRNDFIRDILETGGYQIKDQTRQGKSASGILSGEVDILLHDKGRPISIIEALNLNGLKETYLDEHIDKVYKYDTLGNAFNFLVSYVKVKDFGRFWEKYVAHIRNYKYPYELVCVDDNITKEYDYADIRYISTIHNRNGKRTILDHICLKIIE